MPLIGTHTSGGRSSGRADYRKSDAEYMAAPDQMPNITSLLPRGSHPYMVQGWFGFVRRCSIPLASQIMSKRMGREEMVLRFRGCSAN